VQSSVVHTDVLTSERHAISCSATVEARHLAAGAVQSSHLDLQSGLRVSAGTATFAQPISATTPSTGAIAITHGGLGRC